MTSKQLALRFIILIGLVSFFADITYEGARSVTGPFLQTLGANATIVGFVAGFGEMIGYLLRFVSGKILDKTSLYWPIAIIGYSINLIAVPLMSLTNYWPLAAVLIILERFGKGIRIPSRDVMLSQASHEIGSGKGFGIHGSLDKLGATLGPITVSILLIYHESYSIAFAFLAIPAACSLVTLFFAKFLYPEPHKLQSPSAISPSVRHPLFWLFLIVGALIGAGYADYALVSYHFAKMDVISKSFIPLAYALAMVIAAFTSLILGHLYDKKGFSVLLLSSFFSAFFAPLVFLGGTTLAWFGVVLWGFGIGIQGSIMRSVVAQMNPIKIRGSSYGLFDGIFGVSWFLGSVLMGYLYDLQITALVIFSVVVQLAAIPLLWIINRDCSA